MQAHKIKLKKNLFQIIHLMITDSLYAPIKNMTIKWEGILLSLNTSCTHILRK